MKIEFPGINFADEIAEINKSGQLTSTGRDENNEPGYENNKKSLLQKP